MKTEILIEVYHAQGIRVLERSWKEVFIQEALIEGLSGLSALKGDFFRKLNEDDTDAGAGQDFIIGPVCFRDLEDERKTVNGLVVYKSVSELLYFIQHNIFADGEGELSLLKRECADAGGSLDLRRLEAKILQTDIGLPLHRYRRWRSNRRLPLLLESELWTCGTFKFIAVGRPEKPGFARAGYARTNSGWLLAAKRYQREISGRAIPGLKFLWGELTDLHPKNMGESLWMAFDGERHYIAYSISELPLDLVDEIDEEGILYLSSEMDLLPLEHLTPVCLVRVPSAEERRERIKDEAWIKSLPRASSPLLSRPGLVLDPLMPLPLPEDLPVIEQEEEVWFFLSRLGRNLFIPERKPSAIPHKSLPERESWLVLAKPRRLWQ